MITIVHGRVRLALHQLRGRASEDSRLARPATGEDSRLARPATREDSHANLLLLHGLGERSPSAVPAALSSWPGPVAALDMTGHGSSSIPAGGGYSCEVLMADVDCALAELGPCTIMGRGLGGYVGLLIAGARSSLVRGLIIDDGPGLAGGGVRPGSTLLAVPDAAVRPDGDGTPDPYALLELSTDIRPPDYAQNFVHMALQGPLDEPISVCGISRPPWLSAVVECYGVRTEPLAVALARFAAISAV